MEIDPLPPGDDPLPPGGDAAAPSQRPKPLSRWLATLARIVGTVALMGFALRNVNLPALLGLLETVDWRWWGAGLALVVGVQIAASIRWAALARPIGFQFPLGVFIRRFFEGLFFSLCLPTSIGGDVVKAFRLAHTTHGRVLAGCTILADRLTGLAALAIIALTALASIRLALSTIESLAFGGLLLGVVLVAVRWAVGHLDGIAERLPPNHAARVILARLLPYQQQTGLVTSAIAWSLLLQLGGSVVVACVGRSVGVMLPLAFWFMAVPLVALAMVLPISISGVGVREGGLALLLAPYGVPAEKAVAIGLLWFLLNILCGLAGGLMFLADRKPAPAPNSP
jgi:hypothetical protein